MIYLDIFFIAVIVTVALDVFHFWDEISAKAMKWLTKGKIEKPFELKPFSCSKCSTFWLSIIFILFTTRITLWLVCYSILMAYSTNIISAILNFISDLVIKAINTLADSLNI